MSDTFAVFPVPSRLSKVNVYTRVTVDAGDRRVDGAKCVAYFKGRRGLRSSGQSGNRGLPISDKGNPAIQGQCVKISQLDALKPPDQPDLSLAER